MNGDDFAMCSLLYDGHLVYDNDTLESLAEYGVDEEEIRAGVRFEMNARRECFSCPDTTTADLQRLAVVCRKLLPPSAWGYRSIRSGS